MAGSQRGLGVLSNSNDKPVLLCYIACMSELLREIQEDIQREKWLVLWQRFGRTIIGMSVAVVVGVAAAQGWNAYKHANSEAYTTKILEAVRTPDAKAFAGVAKETTGVHAGIARLIEAQLLMADGKREDAKKILVYLAAESTKAMPNELARALLADEKSIGKSTNTSFPATALERSGWAAIEAGSLDAAGRAFSALIALENAPESMKERAKSALAYIQTRAATHKQDAAGKKE